MQVRRLGLIQTKISLKPSLVSNNNNYQFHLMPPRQANMIYSNAFLRGSFIKVGSNVGSNEKGFPD